MNDIKKLKESIFAITKNDRDSNKRNIEKAFKLFIEMSLFCILHKKLEDMKSEGLSLEAIQGRLLVAQPIIEESANFVLTDKNSPLLDKAIQIYLDVVRESPPFTDVLSLLYEEILLNGKGGEALGKFYSPPNLSYKCSKFTFDMQDILDTDKPLTFGEFCCGSGSLILGSLRRVYEVNPAKLENITVVMNDIDALAVKAAYLQVIASCFVHNLKLDELVVFNCNLITEYNNKKSSYGYRFEKTTNKTPAEILELMKECESMAKELCAEY